MASSQINISEIVIGNRYRKEVGDLESLKQSMSTVGQLQPVVLDGLRNLIAGFRRIEAAKQLGWTKISCTSISAMKDAKLALIAERDENTCREPLKLTEKYAIGRALEVLEKPKAKERQKRKPKSVRENFPNKNEPTGKTSEIVGGMVDMSGRIYEQLKMVCKSAEEDPETFGPIAEEMDRTGKVTPAANKIIAIKKGGSRASTKAKETANTEQPEATDKADGAPVKIDRKREQALSVAEDVINKLSRIPPTNPHRDYAFKVVADWIKHNKGR